MTATEIVDWQNETAKKLCDDIARAITAGMARTLQRIWDETVPDPLLEEITFLEEDHDRR